MAYKNTFYQMFQYFSIFFLVCGIRPVDRIELDFKHVKASYEVELVKPVIKTFIPLIRHWWKRFQTYNKFVE